jgi:class 3 adenylate cyclase
MATNELPTGAVTFLCSDVEGSTKLLPELGDDYVELLQAHHRIIREAIHEHEGAEISTEGDSFFVVFRDPMRALEAVTQIQRSLAEGPLA